MVRQGAERTSHSNGVPSPAARRRDTRLRSPSDALTPRQRDVLTLLYQGKRPHVIADELGLTIASVRSGLRDAYSRLGASGGFDALARARARGLFADSSQARDGRV